MEIEENAEKSVTRRDFILGGLCVTACTTAASLMSKQAFAAGKEADEKKGEVIEASKLVPADNPMAQALKYSHDAAKSKFRTADKAGVKAKDQFCHNCQLFVATGTLKGSKDTVGKCQILPTGYVKGDGWCNSWVKKA
ncbi:MAG: high-potential iron-sulfur protein [Bdellovibrionota bacterium]